MNEGEGKDAVKKIVSIGWPFPIGVAIVVWLLLRLVFFIGYVPTESMEPTLQKGSYIVGTRIYAEPVVGDIIIFRHGGKLLVKRVAAVGGGQIDRDGASLVVPDGCYYVLGDNVEHSKDSRYWDDPFIKRQDIVAKLIWQEGISYD